MSIFPSLSAYTRLAAVILLIGIAGTQLCPLQAQSDSLPAFNALRTPASPAFTILDIAPTAVERPNTPADFAISLLNAADNFMSLPEDFALETSPYWLFSHSQLSWEQDSSRGLLESILRTTSLSFGTARVGQDSTSYTNLSAGIRMSLFSGSMSQASKDSIRALELQLKQQGQLFNKYLGRRIESIRAAMQRDSVRFAGEPRVFSALLPGYLQQIADAQQAVDKDPAYQAEKKQLQQKFTEVAVQRVGFFLELAAARVWRFPGNQWDGGGIPERWAAWLTPSYQWTHWSLVGVGRYSDPQQDSLFAHIDAGARLIYAGADFALSAEYVNRSFLENNGRSAPDSQYRLALLGEYLLTKGTWLQITFGRGSDIDTPDDDNILARLGLSYNLSSERLKLED